MTILNIHVEQQRALVAVNTAGIHADGTSTISACKLMALPHANAVITFRGHMSLGACVYLDCLSSIKSFDEMLSVFPSIVEKRFADLSDQVAQAQVNVSLDTHVVLLGWSPRWERIVGIQFEYGEHTRLSGISVVDKSFVAPWNTSWPIELKQVPSTAAEMATLAKLQSLHAEQLYPGSAWHGDLLLAEITRESIQMNIVRDFSAS